MLKRTAIFLFVFLLLGTHDAAVINPGVVFEIETKDHDASPPRTGEMEIAVEGSNISMPIAPGAETGEGGKMIFKRDKEGSGELIVVDDDDDSYFVINSAAVKEMAAQMAGTRARIDEALKTLTEEERNAVDKARGGSGDNGGQAEGDAEARLKNTGMRAQKSGYPCVKYEVFDGARKVREIWTTDWGNIDGGGEARDAFKGLGDFFVELTDSFPPVPGGNPLEEQNPISGMNMENGFPVVVTNFGDDGIVEDESSLRRTTRRTIDPAEFEPPAGYKRRSMGP